MILKLIGVFLSVSVDDTYSTLLQSKYEGLRLRSFKTKLELFLFDQCLKQQGLESISRATFISFKISDELVHYYQRSWQVKNGTIKGVDVDKIDEAIVSWNEKNKQLKEILYKDYKSNFDSVLTLDSFASIYPENRAMRKCVYCNITEDQVDQLRANNNIHTKNARGKHLEIDRLNSNKEYWKHNIVLACYWCNNAKMDEFTYDEFKLTIGPAMDELWSKRMVL